MTFVINQAEITVKKMHVNVNVTDALRFKH